MERCVCAPQYLSAGTFTPPMVSFSLLYCILLHIKLVLYKPTLAQGQLLVAYRQIQQLAQSGQLHLRILPVLILTNGFPFAAFLAVVNIYPPIGVGNADGTVAQTVYLVCHSGMTQAQLHLAVHVLPLPDLNKAPQIVGKANAKMVHIYRTARSRKDHKAAHKQQNRARYRQENGKEAHPHQKIPGKTARRSKALIGYVSQQNNGASLKLR